MLLGYSNPLSQFHQLNTQGQIEPRFSTMISWRHGPLTLHVKDTWFWTRQAVRSCTYRTIPNANNLSLTALDPPNCPTLIPKDNRESQRPMTERAAAVVERLD